MKKYVSKLHVILGLFCLWFMVSGQFSYAETAEDYNSVPAFVTRGSDSNVLLNLSVESPMQGAAYNDQPADNNGDGDNTDPGDCSGRVKDGKKWIGTCYSPSQEFLGLFDPDKAYEYKSNTFQPVGATNNDHSTSGLYSGNFLNWATMTAIDEFRWALTGGRRTTDTTSKTVVERANMTLGKNHSWFPVKRIMSGDNVAPNTVTPFNVPKIYIYSHGYQVDIGTTRGGHELAQNLNVRAQVCVEAVGLEDNCKSYNNGAYYKPEGLIQENDDRMRFAVMAYSLDNSKSRHGGVLRAAMKYVGPTLPDGTPNPKMEYGSDGIYIDNPNPEYGAVNSGVINYVNKFGANGYKTYDPVSELFYECLNYFKNRGRTPEFADGLTPVQKDGFPVITNWEDPIEEWCQPNYIVGINDAYPWLDARLPGTHFTSNTIPFDDYGNPGNSDPDYSVTDWTNTVGSLEGTNSHLGEVYDGKVRKNTFYVAGLAYYAKTQDIRPDLKEKQTITTFMIDTQEYHSNPNVGPGNMLYLTGKYGGFEEKDNVDTNGDGNDSEPNSALEWDADSDGQPDNYVLATNPKKLVDGLTKVFSNISKNSASASSPSVISGSRSGEGAVYQSVFYPSYTDENIPPNKITWAGSVHASFVDELGRMREDSPLGPNSPGNHILDNDDKVIVFRREASGALAIDKYSLVNAVSEVTEVTFPAASTLIGTFFSPSTVGEQFYVWFSVDNNGVDPAANADAAAIVVQLLSTDSASDVASKTATVLDSYSAFSVPSPVGNTITITSVTPGDATDTGAGTSGVTIAVKTQGAGETEQLDFTGNAEDISHLWNSGAWLNSISDADVTNQRTYNSATKNRYIFTFIDADQDMVADAGEQLAFQNNGTPTVAQLSDTDTIFPYIPVNHDSETLPSYVDTTAGNRDEYLTKQVERVINFTRGLDQGALSLTTGAGGTIPAFRSRKLDLDKDGTLETTWRLGDIVNSSPTVVNKPLEALHLLYKDASYATFAEKYQNRRTVVYSGANDGMLHAFNGGFYEDRFDVYPATHDNVPDVEYLLQPKNRSGATITTDFAGNSIAPHPLGSELWAYIPYNLLPHLYWLTEPNYGHVYYADLKPRIFDAKIFPVDADHPGGWGTVLVGGMRFGGGKINVDLDKTDGTVNSDDRTMTSAFFVLDITNPEVPPKVLGEISFPGLGYTTCYPTVAAMKDKVETSTSPNNWYLVFGSGPAEADGSPGTNSGVSLPLVLSDQKAKIFVLDLVELATNKVVSTLDTKGAPTTVAPFHYKSFDSDNNAFISPPVTVDIDLDYKADAIYFGTQSYTLTGTAPNQTAEWGGKLRRIVIDDDSDPTTWVGDSVFIDLETTRHQAITSAPTVGLDPDGNYWVYFGTGRYFIRGDAKILGQQTFYGIKEPRSNLDPNTPNILENDYSEVLFSKLYASSKVEVNTTSRLVSGGVGANTWSDRPWGLFLNDTKLKGGWYYDFYDPRERNVGQAALFGDLLTFTSYVPSEDICDFEGYSYLYALYYLTGTAPPKPVIRVTNNTDPSASGSNNYKRIKTGTGLVSKPSIHVGEKDGSTAFIQTSDGGILTIGEDNPSQTKSGRTAWGYR